LESSDQLKFENFNKNVIILQLAARILFPHRIQQKQEQICGVTSFMHILAQDQPLKYASFVLGLAENGKARLSIQDNAKIGIDIDIKNKKFFKRPTRAKLITQHQQIEYISDADYIALVGFRESKNKIFKFCENANQFIKTLFGVTFSGEIYNWMKKSGYSNVQKIKVSKMNDIETLSNLVKQGYSITFLTTTYLADLIVAKKNRNFIDDNPMNKLSQIFNGHFIQLKNIEIDDQEVKLSIITWGAQIDEVTLTFDELKNNSGLSTAIIGKNMNKDYNFQTLHNNTFSFLKNFSKLKDYANNQLFKTKPIKPSIK